MATLLQHFKAFKFNTKELAATYSTNKLSISRFSSIRKVWSLTDYEFGAAANKSPSVLQFS
jgi:hypothetical protein